MCMGIEYSERHTRRLKREYRRKGYVVAYKVVNSGQEAYYPIVWWLPEDRGYKKGEIVEGSSHGIHIFLNLKGAEDYKRADQVVIQVFAKPEWIIDLGYHLLWYSRREERRTGRVSKVYVPKNPEKFWGNVGEARRALRRAQ